ncbi:MAG: CocE/NonD family hydrolase [Zymomonas mobilis subsp. pomaceae]|uniref:CocE/NonD family hydrolase n=1 Tax=Zymomonas mobilis TaxID=542 RepID=UPI0039EC9D9F
MSSLKSRVSLKSKQAFLLASISLGLLATIKASTANALDSNLWPAKGDIPVHFSAPTDEYDYIKRDIMIPMRDGIKLHTVIVVPKEGRNLPILLTRTPYNASGRTKRADSPSMLATLPEGDEVFVQDGYIRVFQDVRGKYGSEGDYVVTRPVVGDLNPTKVDHTTDAWDTIDWLVKNIPETNGKVGMIGSSYEGFTVVMALLNPHPALKVAAPESPMVDGWMGDDWFHYGAFRQAGFDYFISQMTARGQGASPVHPAYDDYKTFLKTGSAGDWAKKSGIDQIPWWQRLSAHPAYDKFWQDQALDKLVAAHPSKVPTMWIQGLWDQEDMWGAIHSFEALKMVGQEDHNYLVMGPWRHSQVNYNGSSLGALNWNGDTALQFRRDVLLPFFNHYLKDQPQTQTTPRALIYNTGENHWDKLMDWQTPAEKPLTPLYLQGQSSLTFTKPSDKNDISDHYVSDPKTPVPYLPVPITFSDSVRWKKWLVEDQRFASSRPDVLTYETKTLDHPVKLQGAPFANLFASTTGSDVDWVVKLIDVYPDEVPSDPKMGGYQLAVSMDIFRGRYRDSFEKPTPIPANKIQHYRFRLPAVNHVFQPGHRIMVQIQSSLFPLYDRNPQRYVQNIMFAKPEDYVATMETVMHSGDHASSVELPLLP